MSPRRRPAGLSLLGAGIVLLVLGTALDGLPGKAVLAVSLLVCAGAAVLLVRAGGAAA